MAKKPIVNLIVFKAWSFFAGCLLIAGASAIHGSSQSSGVAQKRQRRSQRSVLMASRIARFAYAALAVALAGCAFGPDFVPPAPQLPEGSYTGEPATDPWLQQTAGPELVGGVSRSDPDRPRAPRR